MMRARVARELEAQLLEQGAVDVRELVPGDWEGLASWARLRPLEQRRLMRILYESS